MVHAMRTCYSNVQTAPAPWHSPAVADTSGTKQAAGKSRGRRRREAGWQGHPNADPTTQRHVKGDLGNEGHVAYVDKLCKKNLDILDAAA